MYLKLKMDSSKYMMWGSLFSLQWINSFFPIEGITKPGRTLQTDNKQDSKQDKTRKRPRKGDLLAPNCHLRFKLSEWFLLSFGKGIYT